MLLDASPEILLKLFLPCLLSQALITINQVCQIGIFIFYEHELARGSWVYLRGKISSEQIMQHFSVVCTVVQRQSGAVGSGNLAQPAQLWSVNCRSPSNDEHDMLGEGDANMR